jgi:hypothetical protein
VAPVRRDVMHLIKISGVGFKMYLKISYDEDIRKYTLETHSTNFFLRKFFLSKIEKLPLESKIV